MPKPKDLDEMCDTVSDYLGTTGGGKKKPLTDWLTSLESRVTQLEDGSKLTAKGKDPPPPPPDLG